MGSAGYVLWIGHYQTRSRKKMVVGVEVCVNSAMSMKRGSGMGKREG